MSQKPDWNEKRAKIDWVEKRSMLRTAAEGTLFGVSATPMGVQPSDMLMHELLVHKVELEMQIEELKRAHVAMEESRDRYVDLYDFAPVGYVTISRDGLIDEINLTGASLLGVERSKLLSRRFSKFVSVHDRDRWHRLFMNVMDHGETEKYAFDVSMTRADESTFMARIDCQRRAVVDAPPLLRITLFDLSKFTPVVAQQD